MQLVSIMRFKKSEVVDTVMLIIPLLLILAVQFTKVEQQMHTPCARDSVIKCTYSMFVATTAAGVIRIRMPATADGNAVLV